MKFSLFISSLIASVLLLTTVTAQATQFTSEQDKLSYTIGIDLGNSFKKQNVSINADVLAKGIRDVMKNQKRSMTKEEMQATLKTFQTNMIKKRQAELKGIAEKNKKDGENFLTANKKKSGVVALKSGLQYKVIQAGKGKKPTINDTVTVTFTGKLINGTVFDSTDKTGKPVSFRVNQVIPGWTEALQLMPEGSTWELYVPSSLAYGSQGIMGPIGPNATLIFQVHLLSIKKAQS